MTPRSRVLLLIAVMAFVVPTVAAASFGMLLRASLAEERARLVATATSHARLIEAVARFNAQHSTDYPRGPRAATLSQIVAAHGHYHRVIEKSGRLGGYARGVQRKRQLLQLGRSRATGSDP